MLIWRIVLYAFISQAFIQLDSIVHPFTCHKHRPLISELTSETFKLEHHECRKVMTAEGWLHPHPFYLYIAVAMFLQTGACHWDIILGIDYHRIFHVLRLIARNKRLPVLWTTDKLVVEVLGYSVELFKLSVFSVSPSYSIIAQLLLVGMRHKCTPVCHYLLLMCLFNSFLSITTYAVSITWPRSAPAKRLETLAKSLSNTVTPSTK